MRSITNFFLDSTPSLGKLKRYLFAIADSLQKTRASYSQHGEDIYLFEQLKDYDLTSGIYVDIGSNHPTTISNSYLFYRHNLHGIAVEPNLELAKLHQKFRPLDIVLNIGCGDKAALGKFEVGKAPVLSRFQSNCDSNSLSDFGFKFWKMLFVPILPLSLILESIDYEWIFFLNVDVEGLDYQVIDGSLDVLPKVLFCCVEFNNELELKKINSLMSSVGFILEKKIECNLIYKNQGLQFKKYLMSVE